jgi:uncharacterized membrane protein YhhN
LSQEKIVNAVGAFVMIAGPIGILADLAIYKPDFQTTILFLAFGLLLSLLGYAMLMGLNLSS